MKKYFLIFGVATLFFSCKKDKQETPAAATNLSNNATIVNLWEATISVESRYVNGAYIDGNTYNYPAGESWLRFKSDSTYIDYDNGAPFDTGTYNLSSNLLTFMSAPNADTVAFTVTTLTSQKLVLFIREITVSSDTTVYETQLTFKKI